MIFDVELAQTERKGNVMATHSAGYCLRFILQNPRFALAIAFILNVGLLLVFMKSGKWFFFRMLNARTYKTLLKLFLSFPIRNCTSIWWYNYHSPTDQKDKRWEHAIVLWHWCIKGYVGDDGSWNRKGLHSYFTHNDRSI